MESPLFDGLMALQSKNTVNFHMPGHKNRAHNMQWLKEAIRLDTTETYGTDNLLHPDSILKRSLEKIAEITGAARSLYSVNGTTGSIYMAQSIALQPGDTLLVQRDSHKSVYSGAILNRLELDFVYPKYNETRRVVTDIDADAIEEKLKQNPKIRAVMVVYPNYYGITSDLTRIADICHRHDALLIVDEAHGSHMHFSKRLPQSALMCGADIVLQSTHKTLPSLTQTSLIHLSERVDRYRLKRAHALFQTTSPSYVFMASIENALLWMHSEAGRMRLDALLDEIEDFRAKAMQLPGFELLAPEDLQFGLDLTRILFRHRNRTGGRLKQELYHKHNIALEMADLYYALALSTVNNEQSDFDALYAALEKMADIPDTDTPVRELRLDIMPAEIGIPMYEAYHMDKEEIRLEEACGRLAGQQIIPYPPGVPMVLPGEKITQPIVQKLLELQKQQIDIVGMFGPDHAYVEVLR